MIWGSVMGACLAMALPFLFVAILQRRAAALFFIAAVVATVAIAAAEFAMMRAGSTQQFETALRWAQVPIFVLVVSIVGFIRLYFGTGRLWLGIAACAMRLVCLIIDFLSPVNLNFREITSLQHLRFLGETVSTPVGVLSPWTHLAEFSSLLLLLFVVDASVSLWRQRKPESRRRALIVGGSIASFIVLAAGVTALIHLKIIEAPYLVSFPFVAIVGAMACELGYDLFVATQVAKKLQQSEASLYESEERFRITADAAPVMIWMSGPDKLCTFFNKSWLDFTGRTLEQELGNGWSEGVHAQDFDKCLETYVSAFDVRKSFTMQYRLRNRHGEYRWISDNGVPRYDAQGTFIGYIGACVDLTELVKREEVLRQFEERVTLAADAAGFGVWEMDVTTRTAWMSDSARDLFQLESTIAVTHETFQDRVHTEDRAFRQAAMNQAVEERGGYEIEYRAALPEATLRWIAERAQCAKDESGEFTRLIGVSADVTRRKLAEEQARRHREEIGRLSRVALLGEMSASIAHELNQPLTAIINNASAAHCFIDQGVKLDTLREILVDIAADGHRAHDVINNIRNTIKKGATLRESVNLNVIVTKVAHMFEPDMASHSCELETSLAKDLPAIEANPVQILQVLINLVSNALDAMRDTPPARRKVQIATKSNGNRSIEVAVRDSGTGIPDEVRERLFDQFFTTKEKGLGMGLAIVRSIVEAHSGTIEVEDLKGGGARFCFILPINQESAE